MYYKLIINFIIVKIRGYRNIQLELASQLCQLLLYASLSSYEVHALDKSYLMSPCLSFPPCKMSIIIILTQMNCFEDCLIIYKVLEPCLAPK